MELIKPTTFTDRDSMFHRISVITKYDAWAYVVNSYFDADDGWFHQVNTARDILWDRYK